MYYIGLDVGTSGCKASVSDAGGNVVAYTNHTYSILSPEQGYVEIDAAAVWACVKETLTAAVHKAEIAGGVNPSEIAALAVASFGEAIVLVGEDGDPLAPSIYYSDIRGNEETNDIADAADAGTIMRITGMPPNPMFSANKLLWIKKHQPELLDRAKYMMLFGDFIAFKLTGERVIDYSLASRTMLFDINAYTWSDAIANALGLPVDRFSKPVQAGTPIAHLLPEIAEKTGLPHSLLVVAGGHDQALAALGSGALQEGQAIDGMGSTECITTVIEKGANADRMAKYGFCCEPHVVAGKFITLAFNASSGTALSWYRDRVFAHVEREAEASGKDFHRVIDNMVPHEITDVLFLPYVGGSGTPYMDSTTGGAFIGLTLATEAIDMYKAVLEGGCFDMRFNLELLTSLGLAPNELRVVGGNTRSEALMQIKADIFNREIHVLKDWEIGTVALTYLCAASRGEEGAIFDNVLTHTAVSRVYTPNRKHAEIYNEKMERYKKLYPAVKGV